MFYDRNGIHLFTAFGVDVFLSFWYLLLMAFIVFSPGIGSGGGAGAAMVGGVVFAVAVTLSLLVHEYGHAFVSKTYDLDPSIMLHGFGGLCMHRPASTDGRDAAVLFAGPGAGLVFGAICWVLYAFAVPQIQSPLLSMFVADLLWVNIAWSLINLLLPIWPLDGGKLFHLLLRRFTSEQKAQSFALRVSLGTTVVAGLAALSYTHSIYLALLAFFLIMNNVNALRSGRSLLDRPASRGEPSSFQSDLLEEADEALENGEWNEAYRLCHQLRATGGTMSRSLLDDIWEILAVSAVELGKFDEAESYLDRAPDSARVQRAREKYGATADAANDEAA